MTSTIQIGNSRIDVEVESGQLAVSHEELLSWVRSAAESVAIYYHRYPVSHVLLRVMPTGGKGVRGGRTFGAEQGGMIRIHVGSVTNAGDLKTDWMLTHEMIHLAFPSVADKHHWIEEGLATYIEPIARVRAGFMDASTMWAEVARDLPQGLPAVGDEGLDNTHTWGRTYWGGALFCFLADVEIHRKTQNKKGLEDALRGILDAGGDIRYDWDLEKTLKTGDRATGVDSLLPLYEKMKDAPVNVDLDALWKQLGIERRGDRVIFDDGAPLAAVRKSMTFGSASPGLKPASSLRPSAIMAGRTAKSPRSSAGSNPQNEKSDVTNPDRQTRLE
ncbi:MAG: hypothetical protein WBP79_05980 [Candidatus Acidiferrales bacterium]